MKKVTMVLFSVVLGTAVSLYAESSMKCGAGKCGSAQKEKMVEKKESGMKCGAGKCGQADKKEKSSAKCGAGHMKENGGKCS